MIFFLNVQQVMETVILESVSDQTIKLCRFTDELQIVLLSHIRETRSDKIMFGKHISI